MRLLYIVLLCGLLLPATLQAQATADSAPPASSDTVTAETVFEDTATADMVTVSPVLPPEQPVAVPATPVLKTDNTAARPAAGLGLGKMALSLAIVVAIVILLGWAFKKLTLRLPGSRHIKIISTMPLGPKERLLVIEIQGKQRVLGVTAQSINLLFELENSLPEEKLASDFHTQLQSLLKK
jgi:flagellar protein FliO/FliZ